MIQKETNLKPSDRCGVWSTRVFQLYTGSFRKCSSISNFVKISVKKTQPNNQITKKSKSKSIIITTKKELNKIDGSYIKFKTNNNILLKKRLTSRGKTINGPASLDLKRKKFISSFLGVI
uniref:Ribosomal protein L14 n=1 Tax=Ichthyophthirius multifiliis TaxID=5932 RepID=G1FLE5_ICHMU|nr:ribosomal protein L14 [Ichthyophthirius multifiliis]AEL89287.1 ribosomal protein L14 [Ichthyophthirius multifiliis]